MAPKEDTAPPMRLPLLAVAAAAFFALCYLLFWGGYSAEPLGLAVKSLCALCLGLAVFLDHRSGPLLVIAMVFFAAGDILLALNPGFGAVAFVIGYSAALLFFVRNQRPRSARHATQRFAAWALAISGPPLAMFAGRPSLDAIVFLSLCASVAAYAWISRFSRYRTGIGAVLVLAAIVLTIADLFGEADDLWVYAWALYTGGLILITLGVIAPARFPKAR